MVKKLTARYMNLNKQFKVQRHTIVCQSGMEDYVSVTIDCTESFSFDFGQRNLPVSMAADTLMMYLKHSEKCTEILPLSITLNDCIMEKNYETLRIKFNKPLAEIDKEFEEEKEMFGVESLKEFIDGYESSRFTQISETEAIITSEYNMNHIVDWIERFAEDMVYS